MKQLSTVLNNILPTAEKTDIALVEQKSSSISVDLKTITQEMERCQADLPQVQTEKALALLTSLGNLSQKPKIITETVFSEGGPDFLPVSISCEELNPEQKAIAREITKKLLEPISSKEFGILYLKMRLLCVRKEAGIDEKATMYAYFDGLKKYPATIVKNVMSRSYKWFPSFYELEEACQIESAYLDLMKKKFMED